MPTADLLLFHWPNSRSTRALWMIRELQQVYDGKPTLTLIQQPSDFRTNKPEWYLELNPNGKVPFYAVTKWNYPHGGAVLIHANLFHDSCEYPSSLPPPTSPPHLPPPCHPSLPP